MTQCTSNIQYTYIGLHNFLPWAVALHNLINISSHYRFFTILTGPTDWLQPSSWKEHALIPRGPLTPRNSIQSPKSHCLLNSKLVPDNLSTFHLHLLVKPLPVAAALHSTLAWAAFVAGVEAAHAIHIQTVTHVLAVGEQLAFAVVHFALGSDGLSACKRSQTLLSWFCLHSWSIFQPLRFSLMTVSALFISDRRKWSELNIKSHA